MGYADIHFHILPGVDDGPSAMDESVALAAAAVAVELRDPVDHVVGDPVALVLAHEQLAREVGALRKVVEHLAQQRARACRVLPSLGQHLEQPRVAALEELHTRAGTSSVTSRGSATSSRTGSSSVSGSNL